MQSLPAVALPERYEVIGRIATGGMASVWCALDRTLDRPVAIKLLADQYANDELAGRRFTREARVAARLSNHPNVVTIYDVGRALPSEEVPSGRPFIVMEHLPGGTAADALRTGNLDQPLILKWLREAAAALDYAHGQGVVHRDVKLSNFLLDRERVLHVADFGIAQLGTEDTLSGTGEVLGTTAYLAPERVLGMPATQASDRYALAVAAFELLVGRRPFTAEGYAAQARQHLEEPPPLASRLNPALAPAIDAVLMRGMAKQPDQRFASATELVEQIGRALIPARAQRPAATRQLPPPTIYARRHVRRRAVALFSLIGALLCVGVAVAASVISAGAHRNLPGGGRVLASAPTRHSRHAQDRAKSATAPVASVNATATSPAPTSPASTSPAPTSPAPPSPAPSGPAPANAGPTSSPAPGSAAALEAQGHQLMGAGNYQAAIPVLRQAVASAPHSSLTYAYALYDLGHSLRLAGEPRAAVAILWQRLKIPNQTSVVRYELTLALEALGQRASSGA